MQSVPGGGSGATLGNRQQSRQVSFNEVRKPDGLTSDNEQLSAPGLDEQTERFSIAPVAIMIAPAEDHVEKPAETSPSSEKSITSHPPTEHEAPRDLTGKLRVADVQAVISLVRLDKCFVLDSPVLNPATETQPSLERCQKAVDAPVIILPYYDGAADHWSLVVYRTAIRRMTYYDSGESLGVASRAEDTCRGTLSRLLGDSDKVDITWQPMVCDLSEEALP